MKSIVIYDSVYGNTKSVADAVAAGLKQQGRQVLVISVSNITEADLNQVKLVVVGTPTHGGQATSAIRTWLNHVPDELIQKTDWACFDTRIAAADVSLWLKCLLRVIGYAADKLERKLVARGGKVIADSMGFWVQDKAGPLKANELARAQIWGKELKR